jgi:hypothetical protein
MPNKRTTVRFVVFAYTFTIIRANDVQASARRLGSDLTGCFAAFITREDKPMHGWLVFPPKPSAGMVAHESYHAIRHMLTDVGAELDDETVAYHLHHLVNQVHKFISR